MTCAVAWTCLLTLAEMDLKLQRYCCNVRISAREVGVLGGAGR